MKKSFLLNVSAMRESIGDKLTMEVLAHYGIDAAGGIVRIYPDGTWHESYVPKRAKRTKRNRR